jgi:aminoglycoside phosphotransferase
MNYEKCGNCGADAGLHHYETMQCPKNGIEETRFDRINNKFYPQQWEETTFVDAEQKKLEDAAPDLLKALQSLTNIVKDAGHDLWISHSGAEAAIKKATE